MQSILNITVLLIDLCSLKYYIVLIAVKDCFWMLLVLRPAMDGDKPIKMIHYLDYPNAYCL